MAYSQTMTIKEFMRGTHHLQNDDMLSKLSAHFKKHKIAYRIVGTTIFIFVMSADIAFAASTGIDAGGRKIYTKLLGLAKWVIIIKGGWDIINSTIKGDFDFAKKSFFSYLLVYVILLGLPWALNQVDSVFKDL